MYCLNIIRNTQVKVSNPQECQKICEEKAECFGFSYRRLGDAINCIACEDDVLKSISTDFGYDFYRKPLGNTIFYLCA